MKLIKPTQDTKYYIHSKISKTPVNTDSIEAMTPETDKKVIGTFINVECPGQPAKVSGRYYRGMQYFCKNFEDNERTEIPLSVARWINERIFYGEHSFLLDEAGNQIKSEKKRARYKFMVEQIA